MIRAGTLVAAPIASSNGIPSAWRFRTASIIVSVVPASVPSSRIGTPSATSISTSPRRCAPCPPRAAAVASLTRAARLPAAAQIRRTVSSARWWPSTISCTKTSARVSATPTMPGSREPSGRIALKRCETVEMPRSKPACACSAVASVWPAPTTTPRARARRMSSPARGSSGASVRVVTRPASSSRSSSARSGSRRCSGECVPSRSRGEERPLEVRADDVRGSVRRKRAQGVHEHCLGRRDERRLVRRHPDLQQRLAGNVVVGRRRREEVDAGEAVDLQVDEARNGHASPAAARQPDARHATVGDVDVARDELAADERRVDAEPHLDPSSAADTEPPPLASRVARSLGVDAGEQRDERDARVAGRRRERGVDRFLGRAAREDDVPPRPAAELVVVGRDRDHQAAVGAPEPHHRHRRDRVQHELLRGTRLQPRGSRDHLGPDDGDHLVPREAPEVGVRDADDRDRERAGCAGRLESGDRVRRRAARAHGDDGVARADRERAQVLPPRVGVVLGIAVLRDDRDHLARRGAERRTDLVRVERRERAGGAGADVDEPPAGGDARRDRVDRRGEGVARVGHRTERARVAVRHQPHELARRPPLQAAVQHRLRPAGSRRSTPRSRLPTPRPRPAWRGSSCARTRRSPTSRRRRSLRRAPPPTAPTSSGISSRVRPKLGSHSCAATPCRSHVSRRSGREPRHERRRLLVPVLPVRIGRERRQPRERRDDVPVGDPVRRRRSPAGGRSCSGRRARRRARPPRGGSRRRTPRGTRPPRRCARAEARRRSAPRSACTGSSSAPDRRRRRVPAPPTPARPRRRRRRRTRAPSRPTRARTRGSRGLLRHAAATRRPSSSTWHSSGWNVTQRLSASPPKVRPSPHGLACTTSPTSCEASTMSRIVSR